MKQANLRAHIRQLCCLGLPSETLMPRLFPLIRALVPADSAGFFWVDASGDMQNLVAERMLAAPKMRLYFEHFYEGGKYDFRKNFLTRANSDATVAVSENDAAFRESAYYNEILKDLDAHHVLYGMVRSRSDALGQLSLYRSKSCGGFSQADQDMLASIMHYVSHAVAAPTLTPALNEYVDSNDDAVLIVRADGTIVSASEQGKRLAVQAADGTFSPAFMGEDDDAVKRVLSNVISRLTEELVPLVTHDTRWGRIQLRAYRINESGINESSGQKNPKESNTKATESFAVRIARQEPVILKFARALQNVDLPPRQQEVAMLLAQGMTNPEIATRLNLSINTVAHHIKQLFSRLEAHGRGELVIKVIASGTEE
jgi:DNA-binding CsgD family transcriptional regulator